MLRPAARSHQGPRAPPRLTHHTPHGPDLLWVSDDHSPFHSLCLQPSTRAHHFTPEPGQQVLKPLLRPAARSSPSGDGGTDIRRGESAPGARAARRRHRGAGASAQSPGAPAASQEDAPPLPPSHTPAFCHKPHSSCSARRLSSQDTFSVWTAPQSSQGTSRKSVSRVRARALGQSGTVRAQQSWPPLGCLRNPPKVPHLPLLDGSVSRAEDTPYLSLYPTCQVHPLAMRRHRKSVR